ncbi:MAG: kelch repeat-containing protein [Verrucomicrobiales bacterium]|nr:kelch repeat-containing protein [Verrucomicrobiales bacterium]
MAWLACGAVCLGQPAAPGGLVATPASPQQIILAWNDNSSNELGFQVEQSSDGIAFSAITTTSANVIAFAATNLNPAVKYYFRVRAFNGAGNSAYSKTNSATTFTPLVQWQLANFTPVLLTNAAVSGLAADPDADGMVNLFEYALNHQPLLPDNANLSSAGTETILTNSYLTLNYSRNATAIDVLFGANVSSNLTDWFSGTNVVTGPISVSTNAGLVTEKFRANAPLTSASQQFMQLTVTYNGVPNSWETGTSLPVPLVEMTSAWLGDKLYATGMYDAFNPATTSPMRVFNILSNTWTILNPERPYTGNHHAAEVFGGRLYIIGGCDANSDGKVQIYDPATNGWSLGAPMPYPAGSCASAVINGKIYVAGGLVGVISGSNNGYNTNAAAVYDPVLNSWASLPPLPVGMNHTASGTDGSKFYVFGGRAIGNAPDNGYNTVQIYDPAGNTWASSSDPGSALSPLPQARGGMGKAVYYNGEFYIMGGETVNGSGATPDHVYNRVDIYNVASNTWRLGTPMPTGRHGIYPALRGNRIYVAGGGPAAGVYYSTSFDIYILP